MAKERDLGEGRTTQATGEADLPEALAMIDLSMIVMKGDTNPAAVTATVASIPSRFAFCVRVLVFAAVGSKTTGVGSILSLLLAVIA